MASSRSDGSRPSRRTMALNSSSVMPSRRCLGSTDGIVTGGAKAGDQQRIPLQVNARSCLFVEVIARCVLHIERETWRRYHPETAARSSSKGLEAGDQGEQESGECQSIRIRTEGSGQAQALPDVQRAQAGVGGGPGAGPRREALS